jgi:PAS domain-containing protein
MYKTRKWKMTIDVDEGNKTDEQSKFLAQLQSTLNAIPAYTWYAAQSGGLTFVNKRTADYLGLPKDHPLRFGIDIGAPWTPISHCCIPTSARNHASLVDLSAHGRGGGV